MGVGRSRGGAAGLFAVWGAVISVAGCGGGSAATDDVRPAAGPSALEALSPTAQDAQALFLDVADAMDGTPAQTNALAYLQGVGLQGLIIDCMAEKGFTYRGVATVTVPSPTAYPGEGILDPLDPAAVEADGLGLGATLDGLIATAKAGGRLSIVETPSGPLPPEHEVPGWSEAVVECEQRADAEIEAWVDHPPWDETIPFYDLVEGALASEAVSALVAAYPDCMAEAGWSFRPESDVPVRGQVVHQLQERFTEVLRDARPSWPDDPAERAAAVDRLVASDAWQDLLEERAHAATDDATCRSEAADAALTALLGPLRTFEEENRDLLERRRAGWAEIEERASRTPDPVTG